jgi:hypothetical protein
MSSCFVTSVATAVALPPAFPISAASFSIRAARRAATTTLAPRAARCRAAASPSPLDAPVMMTTFPSILSASFALSCLALI